MSKQNIKNCSLGCMDFLLATKDKKFVNGRTTEFGNSFDFKFAVYHRGDERQSDSLKSNEGHKWTSKYGYIGLGDDDKIGGVLDGMNEKGLTFGFLWLPETKYEDEMAIAHPIKSLNLGLFGNWILGNFATIEELLKEINDVYVFGAKALQLPIIPPVHAIIHDTTGRSVVIEFIDGKKKIHENPLGIMTNSPTFDWHMQNLRNYVNLSPANANTLKMDNLTITQTGQGSGLLGIPGDTTPASRFVRLAFYKSFIKKPEDMNEAINSAMHIINSFDIPLGTSRVKADDDSVGDSTLNALVKDMNNLKIYFRTYANQNYKMIDMKKIDFDSSKKLSLKIEIKDEIPDVTNMMK